MVLPSGSGELRACILAAREEGVPLTVIGNGTNLLVSDAGVRGLVLKLREGMSDIRLAGEHTIEADAGALLSSVAVFARDAGLCGLEFAHGIPGTLGGAVVMNAGAYGGEIGALLARTEYLDADGTPGAIEGAQHAFGYRESFYTRNSGCIVTRARIVLAPGGREEIKARMDELAARRRASQPLEKPSAGSVFKRPPGHYAGALIEGCALKGERIGGAMVSEKHAGFIVNAGGATASDVLALIELVQKRVFEETGVRLEREIKVIGDFSE